MTRLLVRSLSVLFVSMMLSHVTSARATAFDPPTEEQLNQLKQQAEEAKSRRDAAAMQLKNVEAKTKSLSDEIAKLKTALTMAQTALKASEEKLKPAQEASTKADAAKVEAEKAFAAAKTAADAAAKLAEEAAKKAKEEEAKAQAAQKAAAEALAALNATTQTIESAKKTITDSMAALTKLDADVKALQPEVQKASDMLAAVTAEWVTKQRAVEQGLISLGRMVSFSHSVAPIFAKRCLACHNARTAKGRYNMENYAAILKGGESGEAVVAGDAKSHLLELLKDGSMPKDADPLTKEQINIIEKWITTGATLNAGIEPNAPLIRIVPKEIQPPAPEKYPVPVPITAVAFNPDGSLLATSGYHEVVLWNAADGALVRRIGNVAERVYDLEFSADGKTLFLASGTPAQIGEVKAFNVEDGKLLGDWVSTDDAVFAIALSPDGTRLAAGGADRAIRVIEIATGKELLAIEDHADWVMDVAWSPDGTKLASASRDKTAKVFDVATGDSLVTFNAHGQPVFGVGFSPDGNQVISGGGDKQIRIWNVKDAAAVRAIGGFGGDVFKLVATKEGLIYSSSADKTARIHKFVDGSQVFSLGGHTDWVYSVAFNAASKRVAAGSYTGEVRIWNAEDGKEVKMLVAAPGYSPPVAAK
jgi:hypothetical protein